MRMRELVLGALVILSAAYSTSSAAESINGQKTAETGGILKDRLSPRQRQIWQSIEGKILAEHAGGEPIYPALRRLWDGANGSRHQIYIEMPIKYSSLSPEAARFRIEKYDPDTERYAAVIELNLWKIEEAGMWREVARSNGFVPFKGLSTQERYLEVIAHELTHALLWLTDSKYVNLGREYFAEATEHHRLLTVKMKKADRQAALIGCRARLRVLAKEIEEPAEMMEEAIWMELIAARFH
jgi:hypothetical protein